MSLRPNRLIYVTSFINCLFISLLFNCNIFAQIHSPEYPENRWLSLSAEQYAECNYRLSAQFARNYLNLPDAITNPKQANNKEAVRYYLYASILKLNSNGCIDSAKQIINTTSDPVYKERIAYALAHYYFEHNDLNEAITFYQMAGVHNLDNNEIIDEKFELAYCYFSTKQFDKSEPLLASIKELKEGKYYSAGNYYYGLLAYNENNYTDALQSFDRIKNLQQYKTIVPYYIAEIYYYTSERKKALNYSVELINSKEKLYYDNELHLLVAQCLFEEQRYGEAKTYFEYYEDHTDKIRKEDIYEMGYCYYRGNEWDNAISKFKLLSNTRDSLGQTSMYLLGDCYLKTGDKKSARNAFGLCAEMPFNPGQQEASMILHARLSYEMGYNDDAVTQLNNLLSSYPESKYKDEAKTMLSDLLIKTGSYATAFDHLMGVSDKNEQFNKVYQKVTYNYAIQLFQKGNINAADSFLTLSIAVPADNNYLAVGYFWKGELAYKMHHFPDVISFSQKFLNKNADKEGIAFLCPAATAQHAYLNMGYASMEQNNFTEAQTYFNKAKQPLSEDINSTQVATTREADAVFMQKDYAKAIALYDAIIAEGGLDVDYAKFQKSKILGLQGKKTEKIALLQSLMNAVPYSKFSNGARYELALEYLEENKYDPAITILLPLTENIDARAFTTNAWMKIAFAYQQMNSPEKSIEAYKHLVLEYPSSDQVPAALDAIKSIYIDLGHPEVYNNFLRHNNMTLADSTAMDSTYYSAAESQFASSKWDKAKDAFNAYLHSYPKGIFTLKAHYYRGESNYQLKNYNDALADYDSVLRYPWNDFSENSALRAATISYNQNNNDAALGYFMKLRNSAMSPDKLKEAYKGLLKTNFNVKKYDEAIHYADTLITMPDVDDADMGSAMLYKAKSLQASNKTEDAMNVYRQLDNTKFGLSAAEARYLIAEIYYQQDKLKEAETSANNNIKQSAGYDYWIVKSYILLADILTKEKDYFNAKATLQSIVKNTKIQELKDEASRKLEKVKKAEKQHSKLEE